MSRKRSAQPQKSSPSASRPVAPKPGVGKTGANSHGAGEDRLVQLERLIALMVEKDVVEVELEESGTRWRVRRTEPQAMTFATGPTMAMPQMAMHHAAAGQPAAAAVPEPQGEVFKSPMLGTFYRSPSPDAESFVKSGDRVTADRTLCIIEAMKVMNEIKAEREFEILDVLVKSGEPVEFGQPLFLIR